MIAVLGIDPKRPIVTEVGSKAVRVPTPGPTLPAVERVVHSRTDDENLVGIVGGDTDLVEAVRGLPAHINLHWVVQSFPTLPRIERSIALATDEIVE